MNLKNYDELKILKNYQVNMELLTFAKPDALVMHCLPAIRDRKLQMKL